MKAPQPVTDESWIRELSTLNTAGRGCCAPAGHPGRSSAPASSHSKPGFRWRTSSRISEPAVLTPDTVLRAKPPIEIGSTRAVQLHSPLCPPDGSEQQG